MRNRFKDKRKARIARHRRVRAKIIGTAERPRLSIFRSAKHIYAQLIDDVAGRTLISASDLAKSAIKKNAEKMVKSDRAAQVGENLAKAALKNGIKEVVFDRGGFKYHGRIKALADAARKAGLKF